MRMHHTAVLVSDFDAGLAFWRDGFGVEHTIHMPFPGDWRTLFNADGVRVELVDLDEMPDLSTATGSS